MPRISIIVPVYRVEEYLPRCLDSILVQTFTDWECILIDDGSPDNSGAICDYYAVLDGRVRVIHQENAGVSAARNAGLDAARGEWVAFVDSDDWVERDWLKTLYDTVRRHDVDVVECGYWCEFADGMRQMHLPVEGQAVACWTKFVSRQLILSHAILFPVDCSYGEDAFFSFCCLVAAGKRRVVLSCPLYHYEKTRQNSAMHTASRKMLDTQVTVTAMMEEVARKAGCLDQWLEYISYRKATSKADYLIFLTPPDWAAWSRTFPELNTIRINGKFKKLSLLHGAILFRLFPLARLLVNYLRRKRC